MAEHTKLMARALTSADERLLSAETREEGAEKGDILEGGSCLKTAVKVDACEARVMEGEDTLGIIRTNSTT